MLLTVDTQDPTLVARQVEEDYRVMYPDEGGLFVQKAFSWATDCFAGKWGDYSPIDARYHDFEHTLQGTLCFSALLRGRFQAGGKPAISPRMFELGLLAILLHDTGYLKHRQDQEGTGAKYTLTHVARSCDFAGELLLSKGYSPDQVRSAQNMIRCTGVDADLATIRFHSDEERIVGYALGTADLLGQMAASDYVEKLPILFEEFVEAARFSGGPIRAVAGFSSVEDLMRKTPGFWEKYVKPRIEKDFQGLYHYLAHAGSNGQNDYIRRIEANIARLRQRAAVVA